MKVFFIVFILVSILLVVLYLNQEKLIFFPEKLKSDYSFSFENPHKERYFTMEDSTELHSLLFKADSSKGIVYYLHGNAGSVRSWGTVSNTFTSLGFDLLILDYRGYGKSGGHIKNEEQLYSDVQTVYNELKKDYSEEKIVVLGYSIGTGLAAHLAANNSPRNLILLAPYYNFPDLVGQIYPFLPGFIIKYKLKTNEALPKVGTPVIIFHGANDELIPCNSSERLIKLCKPDDKLILLDNQGHNGINENHIFQGKLREILTSE